MIRNRWALAFVLVLLTACAAPVVGSPSPTASPITLDGTSWTVTQIKGAPTLADKKPTVSFTESTIHGNASCNQYSAAYTQSGNTLTIAAVSITAMACAEAKVNTQETHFLAALGQVTQVRPTSGGAELLSASGQPMLTLAPQAPATGTPLVGTTWRLTGIVANQGVTSPVARTLVTIKLTDDTLTGKACNRFHAPVTITDTTLTVGPIASTKMACPDEQEGKQETTVLAILQAVTEYVIDGETLTLSAPDDKKLVFKAV